MADPSDRSAHAETAARQDWIGVLARATPDEVAGLWEAAGESPAYRTLRRPEIGLVALRGRIGGSGAPFNLGEAPVTRCSVVVEGERVGHAYVLGRDARQAELAALLDALLQDPARRPQLMERVVEPLRRAEQARRNDRREAAETTRVDFFTMVRGEATK